MIDLFRTSRDDRSASLSYTEGEQRACIRPEHFFAGTVKKPLRAGVTLHKKSVINAGFQQGGCRH